MNFWRKSLTARLAGYFLLLSLLPISIVGFLAFIRARNALEQSVFDQLNIIALTKEEEFNHWILDQEDDVFFLARSAEIWQPTEVLMTSTADADAREEAYMALDSSLNDILVRRGFAEIFILTQEEGEVIFSTNPTHEGLIQAEQQYFREGKLLPFVQKMYTSPITDEPTITIASPILNQQSRRLGVLVVHLDREPLHHLIANVSQPDEEIAIYLVDNTHHLISSNQEEDIEIEEVYTEGSDNAILGNDGLGLYNDYKDMPVFGAYRWVEDLELALLAEIPQEKAFAPIRELGIAIITIGAGIAAFVLAAVRLLARQIAEPILNLTHTAVLVAGGDLSSTATVSTEDEIGVLARTFNQMTERLRRILNSLEAQVAARTAELAESVEQLNLINRVGRSANSLIELNTLLANVASLIQTTLDYYAVLVVMIDENTNEIYLSAADTKENIDLMSLNVRVSLQDASIIGHVALTGEPLVVNDVQAESRYLEMEQLPQTHSELALPLTIGDRVLGVLDLQDDKPNAFSLNDVQVLQTLADQIAVAIQNAELFQTAQDARADAEEANRLKTQFLTNMSHELRTPLNAVINFAYLLSVGVEGPLTPGQADMLERIGSAGQHLLNLINDILDLARIESGRIALFMENISIHELVTSVMSTATGLVQDKPVELRQEIAEGLSLIKADRGRIRQVLLNLVSNATKFTNEGHITVRAAMDGEWVLFSVEDTGIGIAEEDIPKAFIAFVQVDGGMTRQVGGTGLGLPISKQFVEMHGGQMWVESKPNMGSTFYFTLPAVQAAETENPTHTKHTAQSLTPSATSEKEGKVDG